MKKTTFAISLLLSSSVLAGDTVPADFLLINTLIPNAQIHMAYATEKNFVGSVVDGYQANSCFLQKDAAYALVQVQKSAEQQGYRLWIYDCYRPQRAVDHFMRWAADDKDVATQAEYYPQVPKNKLVGEYIAEKSGHSRGSTVDLTLAEKNNAGQWQPIDMGSAFDLFDPISHVDSPLVTPAQQANRKKLEQLMKEAGFAVYSQEWWHFTHQPPAYTEQYFDFLVK